MKWFQHSGPSRPDPADSSRRVEDGAANAGSAFEVPAPLLPPVIQWVIWPATAVFGFLPGLIALPYGSSGQGGEGTSEDSSRL